MNRTELDANVGMKTCPQWNMFAQDLFGVYMVLTNVLLLNLLVAMFRPVRCSSSSAIGM